MPKKDLNQYASYNTIDNNYKKTTTDVAKYKVTNTLPVVEPKKIVTTNDNEKVINLISNEHLENLIKKSEQESCILCLMHSAEWCLPCKDLQKNINVLIDKYPACIFIKKDIQTITKCLKYECSVVPSTIFYKNGQLVVYKDKDTMKVKDVIGASIQEIDNILSNLM